MLVDLPVAWMRVVCAETEKPYFARLAEFVDGERRTATVYPPEKDVFNAMKATVFDRVSVVILGQDPYHDENQAHGLCFSVRAGVVPPPSLVNIFKELKADVGCRIPNNGCLIPWTEQGVLLLNTVLTVRAHVPNSHKNKGWEVFTDEVIRAVSEKSAPTVFVLWGGHAQKKAALIDESRHTIVKSAHPSPLSARSGFFESRPFSRINSALQMSGCPEIDWQIPDIDCAGPNLR